MICLQDIILSSNLISKSIASSNLPICPSEKQQEKPQVYYLLIYIYLRQNLNLCSLNQMTSPKKKVIMKNSFALKTAMKKSSNHRIQFDYHCNLLSDLNLAPNLQSRNRDQTSTKITHQNNLRYIKASSAMSVIEIRFWSPILKYFSSYLKSFTFYYLLK